VPEFFIVDVGAFEQGDEFFLAWLAEYDPVRGELAHQAVEPLYFPSVRDERDMAQHLVVTVRDPIGHQVTRAIRPRMGVGQVKCLGPETVTGSPRCQCRFAPVLGDVAADGMAFVTVDAALALLEINRVSGQVPVHQSMAPWMKVQALLANGRAGEDEGTKWAVEGRAHRVLADHAFIGTRVPEP